MCHLLQAALPMQQSTGELWSQSWLAAQRRELLTLPCPELFSPATGSDQPPSFAWHLSHSTPSATVTACSLLVIVGLSRIVAAAYWFEVHSVWLRLLCALWWSSDAGDVFPLTVVRMVLENALAWLLTIAMKIGCGFCLQSADVEHCSAEPSPL